MNPKLKKILVISWNVFIGALILTFGVIILMNNQAQVAYQNGVNNTITSIRQYMTSQKCVPLPVQIDKDKFSIIDSDCLNKNANTSK